MFKVCSSLPDIFDGAISPTDDLRRLRSRFIILPPLHNVVSVALYRFAYLVKSAGRRLSADIG
jgi:hypothetical protein